MRKVLSHIWIWLVLAFLYVPIVVLSIYSFTNASIIGQGGEFSLQNYRTLVTEEELIAMITGTIILAIGVAALSTFLGTIGAVGVYYSKNKVRIFTNVLNQIPVVNADVVTGFSICIMMMLVLTIDKSTYVPLVLGQTVLCAPFVFLSVMPRLKQMDNALFEAATDLGCRPLSAIRRVVLPQIAPGIFSGFVMAITLSLDDYYIATYTKPPVFDTISTYVVNATRGANTTIKTALWALSTVIFIIVVLAVILSNRRKKEEDTNEI